MFQGLSNLASLMRNAQELQAKAGQMQDRLAELRVEGAAGGGMVRIEASGAQQITSIMIEESLLETGDRELLEDLLVSATNQALDQAKQLAAQEMSGLAEGLGLPGLEDALSKFGMGGQ